MRGDVHLSYLDYTDNKKEYSFVFFFIIAAGQGLEPQYSPPKGDVLPLDEPAIR